ncbi:MAG: hypothetical protein M0013_00025 [Actinomycetota bacterium]|nr:hypothetical protein [Actinomycetota bacterium]
MTFTTTFTAYERVGHSGSGRFGSARGSRAGLGGPVDADADAGVEVPVPAADATGAAATDAAQAEPSGRSTLELPMPWAPQ